MRCPAPAKSTLLAVFLGIVPSVGLAADENERPPIEYSKSTPDNCVSKLQALLEGGKVQLQHEQGHGFLPELLKALDVPVESQMLVFSKTSLQRDRISSMTKCTWAFVALAK
jgi:hypothetical protein